MGEPLGKGEEKRERGTKGREKLPKKKEHSGSYRTTRV